MKRTHTAHAAVLAASLALPSLARCPEFAEIECRQQAIITPPPGSTWSLVQARQFVHAWSAAYWSPLGASYLPAAQHPDFHPHGVDYYLPANARIMNQNFLGFGRWRPPVTVNRLTRTIPAAGTPVNGHQAFVTVGWASALSSITSPARGPAGEVDLTLHSLSRYNVGTLYGYHGRAFAFSEALLRLPVQYWTTPPTIQIIHRSERFRTGHPRCGWWIYNYYPGTPPHADLRTLRLFDPITFEIFDPDGLHSESGTLFESTIDLLSDSGDIALDESGLLTIDAADADLDIRLGHPRFLGDSGHLSVSVRNGFVIDAHASGPWAPPPIGAPVPVTFWVPTQVQGTLDLSHLAGHFAGIFIALGEGGPQPVSLPPDGPPPCPADYSADGFIDFFDLNLFTTHFELGDPRADYTRDGFIDFFDLDAFVTDFESGC
ncbi:MAG: hypothetical protein HRU70_00085 [Phycisphaeraceae bacterium]|nr:MAG: hypothetical protein HRU70_00085 [Phycisphaeraceae bacterium]